MSKQVLLSPRAQKDYKKLSPTNRKRVKAALKKLEASDKHLDIKKLKGVGGRENLYRLRVGNYRVTYKTGRSIIEIVRIDPRSKDYSWLD
jgi:mRNA interferase RelE/StbE